MTQLEIYSYGTAEDPRNLLHSVTTGSTTYTFTYDSFGNSNTISAGSRDPAGYEYNPHNGKTKKITYGDEFFVEYVYDVLDNVKEVWYNGAKAYEYTYDARGNCIVTNHNISGTNSYANLNPFRYRGYYYDTELGFYYLNSRYYNPVICQDLLSGSFRSRVPARVAGCAS